MSNFNIVIMDGVPEGARNNMAASISGRLLRRFSEEKAWEKLVAWNRKNKPPLPDKELKTVFESIKKYPRANNAAGKTAPAEILVNLALNDPNILLYTDQAKMAFIRFTVKDHTEHWPCNSKECHAWLRKIYWEAIGKPITVDHVKTAVGTLESFALFEGESYELMVRTAFEDEMTLYYSLSNKDWEAVKITSEGWQVTKKYPILFRHYPTQTPQVTPLESGDVWKLFDFINLKNEDEKIILLVWVITCFIAKIPQPLLYIYGQQGAAKSTTSRLLKKIIDPCVIETSELQSNQNELHQFIAHNHCVMFDNVSKISSSFSDKLCRIVTGTADSKRELYTNDSDVVYMLKKRLCVNGINRLKLRPDLAERTLFIELERVDKKTRRDEEDLFRLFNEALPGILGNIFDIVSRSILIRSSVQLQESPRMADFAKWGYAIAEALGYGGKKFVETYFRQIGMQVSRSIEDDFVCSFIVEHMENNNMVDWEISATDLLALFKGSDDYDEKQYDIPKAANLLSGYLNEVKTLLAEAGIAFGRVEGRKRRLAFHRDKKETASTASSSSPPETPTETEEMDYEDDAF